MSRDPKPGEQAALHFPSRYLRGVDLQAEEGEEKEAVVTIERVEVGAEVEVLDDRGVPGVEERILLHFTGKKKPLILNKTNQQLVARALGTGAMDKWQGKQITIYTLWKKWFGLYQPGIRVRVPKR